MSTALPRPPFQPTLKAPPTAQSNPLQAVVGRTPEASRNPSQVRQKRPVRQEQPKDEHLSERATVLLIRKVLVASNDEPDSRTTPQPLGTALPPLTSSNEVDIQLYAIIAVVIKDFVNVWYGKITTDHAFVDEIIQIIAHCSRALEQRLRQTDVIEVFLNEVPALLEKHVVAYRTANHSQLSLSYSKPPYQIYYALNPHPALDPNVSENEQSLLASTYRQLLVQGVLASLLPTEDLQNSCLRILVTDIIADLILGRAVDEKLSEGWFLHEIISKVVQALASRAQPGSAGAETQADARSRLEKFGLLSGDLDTHDDDSPTTDQSTVWGWFWSITQLLFFAFVALRFLAVGMLHACRQRGRTRKFAAQEPRILTTKPRSSRFAQTSDDRGPRFVLEYSAFSAISNLVNASRRMPWCTGLLSFWQHMFTSTHTWLGVSNSTLDRFLYDSLQQYVFVPSLIPLTLRNVRAVLFPNNSIGPPAPPPPSAEQRLRIRRRAAQDLLSLVPNIVSRTFFATNDQEAILRAVEEEVLDVFENSDMNKHLIYGILELIIVRLVPEMAQKTPGELLAERGIDSGEE